MFFSNFIASKKYSLIFFVITKNRKSFFKTLISKTKGKVNEHEIGGLGLIEMIVNITLTSCKQALSSATLLFF